MWRDLFSAAKAKFEQQKHRQLGVQSAESGAPSSPDLASPLEQKSGLTCSATSTEDACLAPPSLPLPASCSGPSSRVSPASPASIVPSSAVCTAANASSGEGWRATGGIYQGASLSVGREGAVPSKPRKLKNNASCGATGDEGESSQEPRPKKARTNKHVPRDGPSPAQQRGSSEAGTPRAPAAVPQKGAGAKKRQGRPKAAAGASAKRDKDPALSTVTAGANVQDTASFASPPEPQSSPGVDAPPLPAASVTHDPAALSPAPLATTGDASRSAAKASLPSLSASHLASCASAGAASPRAFPAKSPKGRVPRTAWTPGNSPRTSNKENKNNGAAPGREACKSVLSSPSRSLFRDDTLGKFAAILATSQQEREKKSRLTEGAPQAPSAPPVGPPTAFASSGISASHPTGPPYKELAPARNGAMPARTPAGAPLSSADAGVVSWHAEKASLPPAPQPQDASSFIHATPRLQPRPRNGCRRGLEGEPERGGPGGVAETSAETARHDAAWRSPGVSVVGQEEDGNSDAGLRALAGFGEADASDWRDVEGRKRAECGARNATASGAAIHSAVSSGLVVQGPGHVAERTREAEASLAPPGSPSADAQLPSGVASFPSAPPFSAPCAAAASSSPMEVVEIDDEESLGSEDDDADSLGGEREGESEGEEEGKRYVPFRFIRGLWIDVEHEGLAGPDEEEENDEDSPGRERPSPPTADSRSKAFCFSAAPVLVDFRASVHAAYGGEARVRDPRTLEAAIFQAAPLSVPLSLSSQTLNGSDGAAGRGVQTVLSGAVAGSWSCGDSGLAGRGGAAGGHELGGNLQYRPSKLELCVASIEQRLARQRLIANPRDILRGGGGAGGVYYDKDDAFLDDSETFREFGMDPQADFEDQQTVSGAPSESGMDDEDAYEGTEEFVCDNDPTMEDSEPEDTDSNVKKGRRMQQEDENFNPLAWRRYRTSLKQNMTDDAFNVLLDMEEELKTLHAVEGENAGSQAIEKIMVKHLRKAWIEQLANRQGPERLVELNWALVNKLGSALHAISRECGVFLVHKTWVRRTLVHNSTVYEYLLLQLFDMIKKSPLFKKDDSAVIQKVQESFEAWQRVADDSKGPSNPLACLAVPFAPMLFGGDRTQHLKEAELAKSPLLRVGAILIDMAAIFHLRRNGLREYVELGLGAESDLQPDQEQHFPQFLRGLLKQAVLRRFGAGPRFTLSAAYLKAFVAHLKTRFNVNLYERRARRFRELQFQTAVCRAAVEQAGVCTAGSSLPASGGGASLPGKESRSEGFSVK
ncbi:conserved hypothetical protein [Neospora caninum Liverpool]|uniref:Uncharacterized protein n=1 Tax=Neospora caninum (strain Liverpool) TaxID=572307 RepID=F0VP81_NEOCL|nr:conserved hypothetical protein [Neospora caninum Liverpool]CBZ55527.1 conserved hypothetical protein [Neospora caninum Liverpool]CEL70265.1 TPA: hypothetical protein BN1204_059520 [Neospora caninum Liverpool]|eukprot:XP_003885555.1 conserved hypothetical protein [Neospora caninum Liverpool]